MSMQPSDLASNPSSSGEPSMRSDLEYAQDADAFEIEQESAKLQAEVHKLSRELEELMFSRRFTDPKRTEDVEEVRGIGEEREEGSFEEDQEGRDTSRFPSGSEPPERPEMRPQKRDSPSFPLHRVRDADTIKFESFGPNPPRPPPPTVEKQKPETSVQSSIASMNEKLQKQGFQAIPIPASGDSANVDTEVLLDRLNLVLMDFSRAIDALDIEEKRNETLKIEQEKLQRELKRCSEQKSEASEKSIKDCERQVAGLKAKLETASMTIREKDKKIEELQKQLEEEAGADISGLEREKSIFKRHFSRDPHTITDTKILALIRSYEDRKQRHTPEPSDIVKDLKTRLQQQELMINELEEENARLHAKQSFDSSGHSSNDILAQAMSILQLKRGKQIPMVLTKMQQVIRAVPSLENFIKSVSAEVLSTDVSPLPIDEVIPTIRTWKQKAGWWESMQSTRKQFCHLLHLDSTADFTDILAALQRGNANTEVKHFRTLFELAPEEDVISSMNQVFLFVHEMKGLLQFGRDVLGIDSDTNLQMLIDHLKYRLQT